MGISWDLRTYHQRFFTMGIFMKYINTISDNVMVMVLHDEAISIQQSNLELWWEGKKQYGHISHAMGISSTLWEYFECDFGMYNRKSTGSMDLKLRTACAIFLKVNPSISIPRWRAVVEYQSSFQKNLLEIQKCVISMNCSKFQYRQPRNFTSKCWYRGFTPVTVPVSPINQFSVRWSNDDQGWLRKWIGWTFLGSSRVD